MGESKKCSRCNLYTKKPIDNCPKCGRKLIRTAEFEYPIGFKDSTGRIETDKKLIDLDKKKLKRLSENEDKIQEQIKEIEKEKKAIIEEKLRLEIEKKEEEKKLLDLRKKELEKIRAENERVKKEKIDEDKSVKLEVDQRKTSKVPLIIATTFIIVAFLVIFVQPFPYSATEEYIIQESYPVQVPYPTKVPRIITEFVPEQVPVYTDKCNPDYTDLGNWVNYIVGGGDNDAFDECRTVQQWETQQKPVDRTIWEDTIEYRTEMRARDVTKTRPCTKYATLFNQWTGNAKQYFKVGEV